MSKAFKLPCRMLHCLLLWCVQCLQDKLDKDVPEGLRSRPVIIGGALQVQISGD
jgi:hypothetical protein